MAWYRNEQRRLAHRGRRFHFIAYDAQDADPKRKQLAEPARWYLESSGSRWPAIPYILAQPQAEVDALLLGWLETVVFAPAPLAAPVAEPLPQRFLRPDWLGGVPPN